MISLYSHRASAPGEQDSWVRKPALLVLIYEGIAANVLDFDYAPQSEVVEGGGAGAGGKGSSGGARRVWLNVSQEGKSDVEFLREEQLLYGLQVSSRSFRPVTCYQVSEKAQQLLKRLSRKEKEAVHEFVYAKGTRQLLNVEWDGTAYYLVSPETGYRRRSTITDTEDVSYVSSAYVPQCLRYGGRPTLSNAHRAHESAISSDSIRDELDEVITLNSVSIIVAEYIPFGANQIVQLNTNVGSTERVQGGFISPAMDDLSCDGAAISMTPELTSVDILDYTLTNHINLEAEIRLAEESGVVQVETFGVSLNAEGTCFYGMQLEAVMDRIKDNISLDHLARVLVDVQQDSSVIVDSVISAYQRELLQLVFLGDAASRNKVNLIIANEITPHLTAEEYMDKGEFENELKQVIGDTKAAYDISEHDTLIFGSYGLLIVGPNARHHEPLLCAYLQFITIDIFLQNFFARLWILNDDMATTSRIIESGSRDPRSLDRVRYRICRLSKDLIMMEETLSYVIEALDVIEIPPEPPEQAGRSLYERLEIAGMRSQLVRRASDLRKNIAGAHRNLDVIRETSAVLSEARAFALSDSLDQNTRRLREQNETSERSARSLQMLQVMIAGVLAFDFLDRITGDWTVVDQSYMTDFRDQVLANPAAWFIISMLVWVAIAFIVQHYFHSLTFKAQGMTSVRMRINRCIRVKRLRQFLDTKPHATEETVAEASTETVRVTYSDDMRRRDWGGSAPRVTVEFDEQNAILLAVLVQYNKREAAKRLAFDISNIREKIMEELSAADVWNEAGDDKRHEDLAADKRAAIQRKIEEDEELAEAQSSDRREAKDAAQAAVAGAAR